MESIQCRNCRIEQRSSFWRPLSLLLAVISALQVQVFAQERVFDVAGYIDVGFALLSKRSTVVGDTAVEVVDSRSSFLTQRLNILPSSEFGRVKVFANLEFRNGFSMERETGSFDLFESWVQYTFSDELKVRGGILIPPFGSFNALRDASPTFLSVVPPSVFDESFEKIDFMPELAHLLIYGATHIGEIRIEYAGFAGNGEGVEEETAIDINHGKDFGARVGVMTSEGHRFGISAWKTGLELEEGKQETHTLIGADLLLTSDDLELRSEFIPGFDVIDGVHSYKSTFFAVVSYTFDHSVSPYVMFDYLRHDAHPKYASIQDRISFGVNYKPDWRTALKLQFIVDSYARPGNVDNRYVFFGTSILF